MSTYQAVTSFSVAAAADYSSTGQYLLVDINSSGQAVLVASQGAKAVGVLDNDPESGNAARVIFSGVAKVTAGGDITAGAKITTGADARAETAASGDHVIGTALTSGGDGDIIEVLLGTGQHILA